MVMIRGCPVFLVSDGLSCSTGQHSRFQAGLLTPGSSISHAFPGGAQWQSVEFVPGYSGGPVLELHEVPFSALQLPMVWEKHLNQGHVTKPRPKKSTHFSRGPGLVHPPLSLPARPEGSDNNYFLSFPWGVVSPEITMAQPRRAVAAEAWRPSPSPQTPPVWNNPLPASSPLS